MKKIFLLFVVIAVTLISFSSHQVLRYPFNDTFYGYIPPNVGFEYLIPFSNEELSIIKSNRVQRIISDSKERNTVYYFSKNGLLDSIAFQWVRNKKLDTKRKNKIVYKYDSSDRLIYRAVNNSGGYCKYDTIAYHGATVKYYKSSSIYKRDKLYDMTYEFKYQYNDGYALVDQDNNTFYLNNDNEVIKSISGKYIDSVIIINTSPGNYTKTFYNNLRSKELQPIITEYYQNHRIVKILQSNNQFAPNGVQYKYNDQGLLTQIFDGDSDKIYEINTYDEKGMKVYSITTGNYYKPYDRGPNMPEILLNRYYWKQYPEQ